MGCGLIESNKSCLHISLHPPLATWVTNAVNRLVLKHQRFKHTFYLSCVNQDSYANSISDCLARDLFRNKISRERKSRQTTDDLMFDLIDKNEAWKMTIQALLKR